MSVCASDGCEVCEYGRVCEGKNKFKREKNTGFVGAQQVVVLLLGVVVVDVGRGLGTVSLKVAESVKLPLLFHHV